MTRHRTPPVPAPPVDVRKYAKDQKVWVTIGGAFASPKHTKQRVPGVVKRVDQSSVAVVVLGKDDLVVTFHVTEEWRIVERGGEPHQASTSQELPIDKRWDVARFA